MKALDYIFLVTLLLVHVHRNDSSYIASNTAQNLTESIHNSTDKMKNATFNDKQVNDTNMSRVLNEEKLTNQSEVQPMLNIDTRINHSRILVPMNDSLSRRNKAPLAIETPQTNDSKLCLSLNDLKCNIDVPKNITIPKSNPIYQQVYNKTLNTKESNLEGNSSSDKLCETGPNSTCENATVSLNNISNVSEIVDSKNKTELNQTESIVEIGKHINESNPVNQSLSLTDQAMDILQNNQTVNSTSTKTPDATNQTMWLNSTSDPQFNETSNLNTTEETPNNAISELNLTKNHSVDLKNNQTMKFNSTSKPNIELSKNQTIWNKVIPTFNSTIRNNSEKQENQTIWNRVIPNFHSTEDSNIEKQENQTLNVSSSKAPNIEFLTNQKWELLNEKLDNQTLNVGHVSFHFDSVPMCGSGRKSCVDCQTIEYCDVKLSSRNRYKYQYTRLTCAKKTNNRRPFCDPIKNKCSKNNTCKKTRNSINLCQDAGLQPDPLDCTRYRFCPENKYRSLEDYVLSCPKDSPVFSVAQRKCGIFECIDMKQLCSRRGNAGKMIAFEASPNIYGKCPKHKHSLKHTHLFACERNHTFNEDTGSCEPTCERSGFIPANYDRGTYYSCEQWLSGFTLGLHTCPRGFGFNPDTYICDIASSNNYTSRT